MLDTVLTALRGGDFAAAAAAARNLIATEPTHAEAHHLLGLALRQLGDGAGAEAALGQAVMLAPERAAFHVSLAMLAAQRNDRDGAQAALGEALRQDPNQLVAYLALAQLALAAADLPQAEQHLRYAERLSPAHPHVLVLRAQVQLANKQGEAALATLSRASEIAPRDSLVQGTLGLALLDQRHFAFAEQALRNALAGDAQAPGLQYALLQALVAQGRHEDARQEVERVLTQRPQDAQALSLRGQLAGARGAHAEAVTALTAALQRDPRQPRAFHALLASWRALGDQGAALTFVESLINTSPQLDFAWEALLQLQRGQSQRAAATVKRWREARPQSPAAAEAAAQVAEAEGEFEQAQSDALAAVEREPGRIAAQLVLARAELRAGEAVAARARLEPLFAALRDPGARRAVAGWLGRACDACDDVDAAVGYWVQAHVLGGDGAKAPLLAAPDAHLESAVSAAAPLVAPGTAPILLWGAPGSGVERLAALLRGCPDRPVLVDRFGPAPRTDAFQLDARHAVFVSGPEEGARVVAQRWRDGLTSVGATADAIDWLPYWDARLLPPILRGLPGTRLIAALRDPRDMLLNWLAFGAPQQVSAADPVAAAHWLALALEQLAFLSGREAPLVRVVRQDDLEQRPDEVAAGLAEFLGLEEPPAFDALARVLHGPGGLPTAFPAETWRRYAQPLRVAFSALEDSATRLGY